MVKKLKRRHRPERINLQHIFLPYILTVSLKYNLHNIPVFDWLLCIFFSDRKSYLIEYSSKSLEHL